MKKLNIGRSCLGSLSVANCDNKQGNITLKLSHMKYFKILLLLLSYTLVFGQVGINTDKPDANTALDINGKVRIRNIPSGVGNVDSVIIADVKGNLKKSVIGKPLLRNMNPINFDNEIIFMKLNNDLTSIKQLSIDGKPNQMKFNSISKLNKNYDVSTGIFTAPSNALYFIQVFIYYDYKVSKNQAVDFPIHLTINGLVKNGKGKEKSVIIGYKEKRNNLTFVGNNSGRVISLFSFIPIKSGNKLYFQFFINASNYISGFTVKKESFFKIYRLL